MAVRPLPLCAAQLRPGIIHDTMQRCPSGSPCLCFVGQHRLNLSCQDTELRVFATRCSRRRQGPGSHFVAYKLRARWVIILPCPGLPLIRAPAWVRHQPPLRQTVISPPALACTPLRGFAEPRKGSLRTALKHHLHDSRIDGHTHARLAY